MSTVTVNNILRGFTLIEILVVVAIISVLAMVAVANFSDTGASARDAKRQADLKSLQNAIESYRSQVGQYPSGCNGPDVWSGQLGTIYQCTGGSTGGTGQYIVGLAPEYIPVLPTDPRLNGTDSGYVYRTNAAGTVYKLKALKTVETEVLNHLHPFRACDIRGEQSPGGLPQSVSRDPRVIGWCAGVSNGAAAVTAPADVCLVSNVLFNTTYAVWGGIAPLWDGGFGLNLYAADPLEVISGPENSKNRKRFGAIKDTTDVICK